MIKRLINWWVNLPLGYAELHVNAEASREEVKAVILNQFAHRLPTERRARAMRVGILLEAHCGWQKFTRCTDRRPYVKATQCRRCAR